jgi:cobyrinic acid a,c-diamide synthase
MFVTMSDTSDTLDAVAGGIAAAAAAAKLAGVILDLLDGDEKAAQDVLSQAAVDRANAAANALELARGLK